MRIGCAGWSLSAEAQQRAPKPGSHLERYAALFNCTEIDSSFYRPHQPRTYARWAASVPEDFRFAVKMPRAVTHETGLVYRPEVVDRFLGEVSELGRRLGPLLVQLPPRLAFEAKVAEDFFVKLCPRVAGEIVCEPRHASWFTPAVERLLTAHRVARAAADPAVWPEAAVPGGWGGLPYTRLHGSPELYRSKYTPALIDDVAARASEAAEAGAPAWLIFDNTMLGHAFFDALALQERVANLKPRR